MHEGADFRFERGKIGEAALEEIAWAIARVGEARRGREIWSARELQSLFWRQHGHCL
jgi:hypothetical protein